MKQKMKDFFVQKKELFIFLGVLLSVFALVLTIATLNSENTLPVDVTVEEPVVTTTKPNITTQPKITTTIDARVYEKTMLPISGEYVVVREYFDPDGPLEERANAIIDTGTGYITSYGVSYTIDGTNQFEVVSVLSGEVIAVENSDTLGTIVRIAHLDDVVTEYQSLASASVEVGDEVRIGTVIGVAGTSINDVEAGVHVHFVVYKQDEVLNPKSVVGKTTKEITVSVEK